jgi:hypothetical protein
MSIGGGESTGDLAAKQAAADEFRNTPREKDGVTGEGQGEKDQRIADLATEALNGLTPEQIDLIAQQLHPEQRQRVIDALEKHRAIEEINAFLDQFKAPNQESGSGGKKVKFVFLDQEVIQEKGYRDAKEVLELIARYRKRLEQAKGQRESTFTLRGESEQPKPAGEEPPIQPDMSTNATAQFSGSIAETPK